MAASQEFKCGRCGAPLPATPETIIAICDYCGYPNVISGVVSIDDIYLIKSTDRESIISSFWKAVERDFDLRKMKGEIEVYDVEGEYVPVWVGNVRVKGMVEYHKYEIRDKRRVKRTYRDRFDKSVLVRLPARRQVVEFGVRNVIEKIGVDTPPQEKLVDLGEEEWGKIKLPILNTEMDRVDASTKIRDEACDSVRRHYESISDGIDFYYCDPSDPENLKLILVPIWTVYYKCRKAIFRMVFSGWDARRTVATEPVTLLRRTGYLMGALGGVLLASFSSAFPTDFGIALIVMGALISLFFGGRLVSGVRIER